MDHIEQIIRRRMANTGETEEVARAHVLRVQAHVQGDAAQSGLSEDWVSAWIDPSLRAIEAVDAAIMHEIRGLPRSLHVLVVAFPPASVVRAKPSAELLIPAPGRHGIVYSLIEPDRSNPALVSVVAHPAARFTGRCFPEDLEVVGFHQGWDHDRVRRALGP